MKKILLLLLILTATCQLMAQNQKKNELSIGFGFSANDVNFIEQIVLELTDIENQFETNDKKRSGFYLSYKYHFSKRWAAGTTLTYKHRKRERTTNEANAKYIQNFYGANLEGQYTYIQKRVFRMYALAGIGIYTCDETLRKYGTETSKIANHTAAFTYQISPVCLEVGANIGGKLEYGYGYKGIGSIGLYVRF